MKKVAFFFILIILILGFSVNVTASPSINSVSGNFSDGGSFTISGTDFGTNSLDIEWTGGNIESGTNGAVFSKSGWAPGSDSSSGYATRYDNDDKHSGSQSLLCKWSGDPRIYVSMFMYNRGSHIQKVYATWWVKFHQINGWGQWKMWRLRPDNHVNDISPEIYMTNWISGASSEGMKQAYCRPSSTTCQWNSSGVLWLDSSDMPKLDEWVRMEYYAEASNQGIKDGTFIYHIHRPDSEIRNPINYDGNLMTIGSTQSDRWQYLVFGHYWGNGGLDAKAWHDDVFIQFGSRARVEIGDSAIWSNCTHREIQIPTAWSDTSITITLNQGSFANCETMYLFVVDADGNVNTAGYPIRFVTGAGEPPCPPIGGKLFK